MSCPLVSSLLSPHLRDRISELYRCGFGITKGHYFTENFLIWFWQSSPKPCLFCSIPWALGVVILFVVVYIRMEMPYSVFSLVVVFFNDPSITNGSFLDWGVNTTLTGLDTGEGWHTELVYERLGHELRSLCLHIKHFTDWDISIGSWFLN